MCLPSYLWACFRFDQALRHQLGATAWGAVMPGLNGTLIKRSQISLPPLERQHEFARILTGYESLKARLEASLQLLNQLFASLQQRAFRGEL